MSAGEPPFPTLSNPMIPAPTTLLAAAIPSTSGGTSPDPAAVDRAFAALETYDAGAARGPLVALDEAVVASLAKPGEKASLEQRMIAGLTRRLAPVASEYLCAKLAMVGSAAAVPTLAALLQDHERSDPARNALERIPCAEAARALRDSMPKLKGDLKIGVIHSLGVRRDLHSVPELCLSLYSPELDVARAAAAALGQVGTASAAGALRESLGKVPGSVRPVVADGCLACAERLLADGQTEEARSTYRSLKHAKVDALIHAAAERGLGKSG
jgi:HEAT repeat protein